MNRELRNCGNAGPFVARGARLTDNDTPARSKTIVSSAGIRKKNRVRKGNQAAAPSSRRKTGTKWNQTASIADRFNRIRAQRFQYRCVKRVCAHGFRQNSNCSMLLRCCHDGRIRVAGKQDDGQRASLLFQGDQKVQATHPRHPYIRYKTRGSRLLIRFQKALSRIVCSDLETVLL